MIVCLQLETGDDCVCTLGVRRRLCVYVEIFVYKTGAKEDNCVCT